MIFHFLVLFIQLLILKNLLSSFSELDEFLLELDEDVEGMQSTIYYLQQQLREAKEKISQLQKEKQKLLGMPNGSPNHRLIAPEESVDTDSHISQIQSPLVNNCTPEPDSVITNDVNGTGSALPVAVKDIKIERPWTPERNKTVDQTPVETHKKPVKNETPVILLSKDVKETTLTEGSVQSVIVENKNVVNLEKQTPVAERTNNLVDGLEINQHPVLRTSEPASEVRESSREVAHNPTSTVKRTSEGGRGRKRNRPRTPPADKKEENLPVRKRTRRREAQEKEEKQQLQLDFDTDTEVQVAQTLAYWATAKQERTDVQSDPNSSSLGNGELIKKDNEDK